MGTGSARGPSARSKGAWHGVTAEAEWTCSLIGSSKWAKVEAGECILREGIRAPFLAFIQQGTCTLLRHSSVTVTKHVRATAHKRPMHTMLQGKTKTVDSDVAIHTLHEFDIFGAKCLLKAGEVEPYTVIADTKMVLLTIAASDASSAIAAGCFHADCAELDFTILSKLQEEAAGAAEVLTQVHARAARVGCHGAAGRRGPRAHRARGAG